MHEPPPLPPRHKCRRTARHHHGYGCQIRAAAAEVCCSGVCTLFPLVAYICNAARGVKDVFRRNGAPAQARDDDGDCVHRYLCECSEGHIHATAETTLCPTVNPLRRRHNNINQNYRHQHHTGIVAVSSRSTRLDAQHIIIIALSTAAITTHKPVVARVRCWLKTGSLEFACDMDVCIYIFTHIYSICTYVDVYRATQQHCTKAFYYSNISQNH